MNSNYTCVIVDDEQDAIDLLSYRMALLFDNITIADAFTNWEDAFKAMRKNKYDMLFLDVSMPGKSGFDLLKLLPDLESEIIFVTAHDNYALNAFSFAATGYVLKPIDDTKLSAAINKSIERINHKTLASQSKTTPAKTNDKIGIPKNHGIDYISITDILYLESVNKCTQIITATSKYTSSANIGTFRYLVDNHPFFQVHRSYIVNLNCILRYQSSGTVIMQDKKEIPVSRNTKQDFLKLFNK